MRSIGWLCGVLLLVAIRPGLGREDDASIKATDLRVLDPAGKVLPVPAREMLNRYLLDQSRQRFDARRQAIAAIKTPEDIAARGQSLRAFFLRSLGDMPERTPLNAQVTGIIRNDGYHIEKVIFESRRRHHVTANLYMPDGKPPYPGVLLPCGHSDNGKASETYQRAAILLARNGMAVLCCDPIGQGERLQRLDAQGKPVVRGTTEHTMAGIGALLVGRQEASYRVWDGFRALDYLASRPEVDPQRLGCTGNSGGGTMTAYLMALDDRIAVAAPSCYITSLERLFATIGPQDAEQNITGQVAAGMEHADYITMRAPKPTLLSVGTRDFFDIQGSWDTFREVKLIYGRLGFGERVELFESDEPHGFTRPRRIAAARWMSRWLLKRDEPIDEPDGPIASDADLQCTKRGQVLRDFPDERSVFDLNAARAEELRAARAKRSDDEFRAEVRKRIGLEGRKVEAARSRHVATIALGDRRIVKWIFEVEPGIVVPAIEVTAPGFIHGMPKVVRVVADWPAEVESLVKLPNQTMLIQPRGLGETARRGESPRGSPFGRDSREAFLSLHLDRPLLGQRVFDVLAVLEGLDEQYSKMNTGSLAAGQRPRYQLAGVGLTGPIVLHAALLEEKGLIKEVTVERSLTSWEDLVKQGISRDQLANVVPGALRDYDLPDLAAHLAPRPVHIEAPVDASGQPIPNR
jgi:dienelactone hydrolase